MKRIKKKLVSVILAITILSTGLIGSYTTVPAAEFSAGALAASETLEWLSAVFAGVGISISVKELLKPRQADIEKDIGKHIDWDNYDWGDALDSPAAQDQIDELDKTINRLYGNASAKWKEMYEKSLSPTPTPETSPDKPEPSPPVTVAPIDPDKVTPPGWDTLRKASMKNGYLALGAATYWCLKEAVTGWWDKLMDNTPPVNNLEGNKLPYNNLIGQIECHGNYSKNSKNDHLISITQKFYFYQVSSATPKIKLSSTKNVDGNFIDVFAVNDNIAYYSITHYGNGIICDENKGSEYTAPTNIRYHDGICNASYSFHFYVPYRFDGVDYDADVRLNDKKVIWVNPDLRNDHDKNKSPSIPATAPAPAIKVPSLDDLKDLQNRGNNANDDERPSIILDWLKNHYTNPSTDPNPKPDPDPNPNPDPDPKPDPDPNPDPNPDPDPDPNPTPTTAPKPDDENTDVNPDDYKADLRLVFPFCIPFDLVHLIQAFEAEPEAPVFEFPFDLELQNPWTGKKVIDYHHVFKLDMSDYEPVIKIFRIFEIIFFIIGLLMITRQQMIKG